MSSLPVPANNNRIQNRPTKAYLSLPKIGKIAKGVKNEQGRGVDQAHFIIQFEPEYEKYRPVFEKIYGAKPTFFKKVSLVGSTPTAALSTRYEQYNSAQHCKVACDGNKIFYWLDDDHRAHFEPKACMRQGTELRCQLCKSAARFSLVLHEFSKVTGIYGLFSVTTKSQNDVDLMTSFVDDTLSTIAHTSGVDISNIYFLFGRKNKTIVNVDQKTGKPRNVTKNLFYIALDYSDDETQKLLASPNAQPQLPAESFQAFDGDDDGYEEGDFTEGSDNQPVELTYDEFKAYLKERSLSITAETAVKLAKKMGYTSKEEIAKTLVRVQGPAVGKDADQALMAIAIGYLAFGKDLHDPWRYGIQLIQEEFADIPFE